MKHRIFLSISLLLCASLLLGILVFGPSKAGSNEILSPVPQILTSDGSWNTCLLSDWNAYISDHFFLRQELITVYAKLNAFLFGTSVREDVILGKEGWLYYASTLSDFTGDGGLSEQSLHAAARNLELMQEYCDAHGKAFAFLCVPNKNTLYPQFMPSVGSISPEHSMDRLYAMLQEAGVSVIDVRPAFLQQSEPLYFAHDSHWNSRGAALAADIIHAHFGSKSHYFEDPFALSQSHSGDLYEMLFPAGKDTETDPVFGGSLQFSFAKNSGRKPDSITIRTESGNSGSLLCYRDSFGNLLFPYLADSFGSAVFSRSTVYDLTARDADTVLIELVERNLSYLIENIPMMPAPKRSFPENITAGTELPEAVPSSLDGFTLYRGTAQNASAVYLLTSGCTYECFLLEDGGYAAYVPEAAAITGVLLQ